MQIKQSMLVQQIQKKIAPLYLLVGQDSYLLDESLTAVKSAIKNTYECDEHLITINSADDWNIISEEANSYSLFAEAVLLNIYIDKKSIDAAGKKVISDYLNAHNSRCFIIIRAPNVPAKQLSWLSNHEHAVVSVAYPLNAAAMKSWISNQLRVLGFSFDAQIPDMIHHYTQGNMLACAQVIEKIRLCATPNSKIERALVQEHLSDQCEHELFELVEACLLGQSDKAIQILRHASTNKTEATLVLWILTQEVRTLMQLIQQLQQGMDMKSVCAQLKIWAQRTSLYQISAKRLTQDNLMQLHRYCNLIDERIKSSATPSVWLSLENLALSLCTGHLIGDVCSI